MPASWRVPGDMPTYFFHLRIGASLELDESGLELPDSYQAYLEACRAMPRLAEEMLARGRDPLQCRFEIADAHDQRLFEIPLRGALALVASVVEPLAKIALAVEQRNADHR